MSKRTLLYVSCLLLVGGCCLVVAAGYEPDGGYGEDQHHHQQHRRVAFWEILMSNPFGLDADPRCVPSGQFGTARACCSGAVDEEFNTCCSNEGGQCVEDGDCCPRGGLASSCPAGKCEYRATGCFAGHTKVHVKESPGSPIPIEELKTGQHVLCLDTNDDARLPTKTKWCKVHAWLCAGVKTVDHIRINTVATKASGGKQASSLTVRPNHLVMRLTAQRLLTEGTTVASVRELGQFETVPSSAIKAGDTLAVLADAANPTAGRFTTVSVSSAEEVQRDGLFTPVIDSPFIVADGVVVPITKSLAAPVAVPGAMRMDEGAGDGFGAKSATVQHYLLAPFYMQQDHPVGIAGKDAPQSQHTTKQSWLRIQTAMQPFVEAGKALNYEVVRAWWQPRYAAFTANAKQAVSVDDVVALLKMESTWVQPPASH